MPMVLVEVVVTVLLWITPRLVDHLLGLANNIMIFDLHQDLLLESI